MTKELIVIKGNWADEINFAGFRIEEVGYWEQHLQQVQTETSFPRTVWIGSNQDVSYANFEKYHQSFAVKTISDELAEQIRESLAMGFRSVFGIFPMIE